MKLFRTLGFLLLLLIFPCIISDVFAEPVLKNPNYSIEIFVDGLEFPTTMDFLNDGIIVLEKNSGKIKYIQNGSLEKIQLLDFNVSGGWELGLLGILVDENFVFIYVTEAVVDGGEQISNKLYRYTWNGTSLTDQKIIHEFPLSPSGIHVGGIMTKNLDGELFLIIGDMASSSHNLGGPTQNFDNNILRDTGIILNVVKDGSILKPMESQNPIEHYYAIGIRNSFGISVDPITGKIWDTENGENTFDEINFIEKKFNSGWEKIMGISVPSQVKLLPKFENFEYSDPEFSWEKTVAPTSLIFFNSLKFPDNKNNLLVSDCNNGNIYEFKLNSERNGFVFENIGLQDKVFNPSDNMVEIIFGAGFGCVTDLKFGPDGILYVVSATEGKIFRVIPSENVQQNKNNIQPFVNISNENLKFKKYIDADIKYGNFSNSDLSGANFSKSNMLNVEFNESILKDTNLSNSNLKHASFKNTILTNAILLNADVSGAFFENSSLENTILQGLIGLNAKFTNVTFFNSNLEGANLSRSDLSNVDFTGANLSNVDFTGANLSGVQYYNSNIGVVIIDENTIVDGCFGPDFWNRGMALIYQKISQNEDIISEIILNLIPLFCV